MVLPFPPPPPFPSHITINKWLLPFLLPYHYQTLTSRQFCATTRTRVGSWCFRRPISVATTTARRSSWPCRRICIPGGASPPTLAACCSLTFAWRVIRSLLRLLLSTATCGPCRRASMPCRTRLVWSELHCIVLLHPRPTALCMYYCRCDNISSRLSGVAYRTSKDLVTWSDPAMALVLPPSISPPTFNR